MQYGMWNLLTAANLIDWQNKIHLKIQVICVYRRLFAIGLAVQFVEILWTVRMVVEHQTIATSLVIVYLLDKFDSAAFRTIWSAEYRKREVRIN